MEAWTQWLRGVTDVLVLSALREGRSYGYEIAQRLESAGLDGLNEATVYSALRRLAGDGLIISNLVHSTDGPARRYYTLTEAGEATRSVRAASWSSFVDVVNRVVRAEPAKPHRAVS